MCVCLSCFSHVQHDTLDCSSRRSSVNGILQARILELPCPPPGDLPDLGIKPTSLMSPELAGGLFTTSTTWEAPYPYIYTYICMCVCILSAAVESWTTWVWTAQVHLLWVFSNSKYYSTTQPTVVWTLAAEDWVILRFSTTWRVVTLHPIIVQGSTGETERVV